MTALAPASSKADLTTIGIVGTAHFGSHIMQLSLAPVLPLIVADFNVGFATLGWVIAVFYATSGLGQVVSGFIADRIGPHRLLMAGMLIQAASVALMTAAPSVEYLFLLAVTAGIGNSVYHPCDMSILNRRVSPRWIGRAVATHVLAGSLGFALAPLIGGLIGSAWGWRAGVASSAVIGFAAALTVILNRRWIVTEHHVGHAAAPPVSFLAVLKTPPLVMAFIFFVVASVSGNAIMNFAASALDEGYGVTLAVATVIVAMTLGGSAVGTVISGLLIDRGVSHHRIGVVGILGGGMFFLPASLSALPVVVIAAFLVAGGLLFGATMPPRDLLVREAAPKGSIGRSFGMVYSGADIGQLIGPLILGHALDLGMAELVFVVAGGAVLFALPTLIVAWRGRAAPAPAPAPAE